MVLGWKGTEYGGGEREASQGRGCFRTKALVVSPVDKVGGLPRLDTRFMCVFSALGKNPAENSTGIRVKNALLGKIGLRSCLRLELLLKT